MQQLKELSVENHILIRKTLEYKQIVFSENYHQIVFRKIHEDMGHRDSEKVSNLESKRFYWPYTAKNIQFYVTIKYKCIVSKKPNCNEVAPVVTIESRYRLEVVSINFVNLDRYKGAIE